MLLGTPLIGLPLRLEVLKMDGELMSKHVRCATRLFSYHTSSPSLFSLRAEANAHQNTVAVVLS